MDIFDIVGPVMIGPSSSHTAGAARIGRITRKILGEKVVAADIGFHGSFAKTWRGHGADRAILGGLMGLDVDDERLRNSRNIADAAGMKYSFRNVYLSDTHPNTLLLRVTGESGKALKLQAASIGGGRIEVQYIVDLEAGFAGDKPTLIVPHYDVPGVIAFVAGCLSEANINIARMGVFRQEAGGAAVMIIETDGLPEETVVEKLKLMPSVLNVTLLESL